MVTPDARREAANYLEQYWWMSQRRACKSVNLSRSVYGYRKRPDRNAELRQQLRELAQQHPRFGSPMLYFMFRGKGWKVNHKRVERLYREEELSLRRKRRKRYPQLRVIRAAATQPNECWSMDFVHDSVYSGRALRCFAAIDDATRECVVLQVEHSLSGRQVVALLEQAALYRGYPKRIRQDNGPEFRSKAVVAWAQNHNIILDFIQPGKPTQNAHIESFNARFRDECLNQEWFIDLADAQRKSSRWKEFYNVSVQFDACWPVFREAG